MFSAHSTTLALANEMLASRRGEADRERLLVLALQPSARVHHFAGAFGRLVARRATAPVATGRPGRMGTVCCPEGAL